MPYFGDVPIGAHFESMQRVWVKLDERHAQDEAGETQLFWDIASVEPVASPVVPEPAPVEPPHEEVPAEESHSEEVPAEAEQAKEEVAPPAVEVVEDGLPVIQSKRKR